MSKRISHVLEVLKYISGLFDQGLDLVKLRNDACVFIANDEHITKNTVLDGITRQLGISAGDFDMHCANWLNQNATTLQTIVLQHIVDEMDVVMINMFFSGYYQDIDLLGNIPEVNIASHNYREGKQKYVTHLRKERDGMLVRDAKTHWLQVQGNTIRCSVCEFSFIEKYGEWGFGFIEAHHTTPLSELEEETDTTIHDLVPICANCHRMIHRVRPWLTVEELRKKVDEAQTSRCRDAKSIS